MTLQLTIIQFIKKAVAGDTQALETLKKEWNMIPLVGLITMKKPDLDHLKQEGPTFEVERLLWMEQEIKDIPWADQLTAVGLFCHQRGLLTTTQLKALWSRLYNENRVGRRDIPLVAFAMETKTNLSIQQWLGRVLHWSNELGPVMAELEDSLNLYTELTGKELSDEWSSYGQTYYSLQERSEYVNEILESCDDEELEALLPWFEPTLRSKVTTLLVTRQLAKVGKNLTWEKAEKRLGKRGSITEHLPLSTTVMESRLLELSPKPVDIAQLTSLPEELIPTWAPKFSYTHPETQPQIRVFFPGGRHIGHSAILVKTRKGAILLDFGMSVVNNSTPQWMPLLEHVDAVLLSHAHGDHSAGLPYLIREGKDIPWFGRKETRMLVESLWHGNRTLLKRLVDKDVRKHNPILSAVTNKGNVMNALEHFHEIKPRETIQLLPDIEVTTYDAAHLFGSVGYELTIGGKRILYTGDFNSDGTRIFPGARFPDDQDLTIFDGTYYGRERNGGSVPQADLGHILASSSRVLIPAFSLGRTQEILHELVKIEAYKRWKIILTGMGGRIAGEMNMLAGLSGGKNTGVEYRGYLRPDDFTQNTIVVAGQGMLQAGLSRDLFENTADDPDTSVVFCGYQAPYSFGHHLLSGHPALAGKYKQQIFKYSFSGHTSAETLDRFLDATDGKKVIVHEPTEPERKGRNGEVIRVHELDPYPLS